MMDLIKLAVFYNSKMQKRWLSLPKDLRSYYMSMILFPYFCLTDGVLTKHFLANGGTELNPAMQYIINNLGIDGVFVTKIIGIIFIIICIESIRLKGHFTISKKLMSFATYSYVAVVAFILFQGILATLLYGYA